MSGWTQSFVAVKTPKGLSFGPAKPYFDRVVSSLGNGTEVLVTLTEKQDKRTNAQNRAMWGIVYDSLLFGIADAAGYDRHERAMAKELIHEGLCVKFGGTITDKVTGQEVRKFRTSKATKQEFSDYIEWVARFAATEYGIVVALPGEAA